MTDIYRAYITRGGMEYEVTASVYDYGVVSECGMWVDEDPVFANFECLDDNGVEIILTPKELHHCEQQMIDQYWDNNQ